MSIRYRPEVDGLRAISVVAIIFYHAEFMRAGYNVIPGAFLAVEVFFVISGFLITSLILKELEETNGFSVRGFYERRVRRLFPALVFILAFTAAGAWFVLLPAQLVDFAKSLVASLFFVSNFYWDLSLQEYGAESGLLKPLLHTWTLAVEEQFYIIFPFMFVALYRLFGSKLVWWLWGIFFLSLCFAHWHTSVDPHSSFYMLTSRYWELMAGSILAVLIHRLPAYDSDTPLKWIMTALGLALLLSSFVIFNFKEAHHPGLMTTYSVLGTVLIIAFGGGRDPVTRLLSSRPFIWTGLMSYSLYLWHFPLFAYARLLNGELTSYDKLALIALTFVLSVFSYRLVEKPFRSRRSMSTPRVLAMVTIVGAAIVVFSVIAIRGDGLRERFSQIEFLYGINELDNSILDANTWSILNGLASAQGLGPSSPLEPSKFEATRLWFSDRADTEKVLIAGVSVSRDLFNALYLNREKFPAFEFARIGMHREIKEEHVATLFNAPNFKAADTVILNFTVGAEAMPLYADLVQQVVASGKRVLMMSNPQVFQNHGGKPTFDWYFLEQGTDGSTPLDYQKLFFADRYIYGAEIHQELEALAAKHRVKFLNLPDLVCDESAQRCDGVTSSGYKAYYDSVHWTIAGAEYFGARIAQREWLAHP